MDFQVNFSWRNTKASTSVMTTLSLSTGTTYCPPGRDATVADGLLDFQFRNDLAHNVILKVALTTNSITFYVLGNKNDLGGQTIRLTNRGSGSHPSIYRLWYLGDNVAREEFLHTDNYN